MPTCVIETEAARLSGSRPVSAVLSRLTPTDAVNASAQASSYEPVGAQAAGDRLQAAVPGLARPPAS